MDSQFYFNLNKEKSFTLIELLVVIAIIGLITSVALVAIDLPGQRQKAKIAKILEFSSSIQNALGSEAVGIWDFDNNVLDSSGYGNNGTINGGATFTDETPQKIVGPSPGKYALSLDGAGDYINCGNGTSIKGSKTAITVGVWIKRNTTGVENGIIGNGVLGSGYGGFALYIWSSNAINFEINDGGVRDNVAYAYPADNNWHYIVGTFQAADTVRIYQDGVLKVSKNTAKTQMTSGYYNCEMGRRPGNNAGYFNGLLDEVSIYNQALTIGQIQQHYAEGLEQHKNLAVQ